MLTRSERVVRRNPNFYPSNRKPKFERKVPPGCISVWVLRTYDGNASKEHGVFLDRDLAYKEADKMHEAKRHGQSLSIKVDHKAAIQLEDKLYLVNLSPLMLRLPKDDSDEEQRNPSVRVPARLPGGLRPENAAEENPPM